MPCAAHRPLRRRGERGFTLVELLVVVAIIAVLAAILIPRFLEYTDQARVSGAMGDLSAMRNVIEAYAAREGRGYYPLPENNTNKTDSVAYVLSDKGIAWTGDPNGLRDPWGVAYKYAATANRRDYLIQSAGPDRRFDTDDDIFCGSRATSPRQGNPSTVRGYMQNAAEAYSATPANNEL